MKHCRYSFIVGTWLKQCYVLLYTVWVMGGHNVFGTHTATWHRTWSMNPTCFMGGHNGQFKVCRKQHLGNIMWFTTNNGKPSRLEIVGSHNGLETPHQCSSLFPHCSESTAFAPLGCTCTRLSCVGTLPCKAMKMVLAKSLWLSKVGLPCSSTWVNLASKAWLATLGTPITSALGAAWTLSFLQAGFCFGFGLWFGLCFGCRPEVPYHSGIGMVSWPPSCLLAFSCHFLWSVSAIG